MDYHVLNESSSLTNDMRGLFEKLNVTWNDYNTSKDDHLHLFADRIESKANDIASNASMLLEELEVYSSSRTALRNLDDVGAGLGDFSQLDGSNRNSNFNVSLTVGDSWLQDIHEEVSVIESWEDEAEKLSLIAIAAFQNLKIDTSNIMEHATAEAMSVVEANAEEIYHDIRARQDKKKQSHMAKHQHSIDSAVVDDETWEVKEVIPTDVALEKIKSLSLKTYKLRDDKYRDLGVSEDVRRTRHHVGIINNTRVDPSAMFSFNIGAVSHLATSLDQLLSKIKAAALFFHHEVMLKDKLSTLKARTEMQSHEFKSPSQLASEVAALETEAALTRIARLSQSVLRSVRINLIYSRFTSQLKRHAIKSQSSERVGIVERDAISIRENDAENAESYLDQLLIHSEAINRMETMWKSARRELVEMNEASTIESHIAKEEINAEAAVERENESSSLDQIRLLGRARVNEISHVIQQIFSHLTGCFRHIMTREGRQQFLFYVGTTAVLVFVVSTLKEMITLGCICILRFFTAPRLVREYGNLRANWLGKHTQEENEIVLPQSIKERTDMIVAVASAASKMRFPLRSVLIHGPPGSGKSMIAKAIAQSIPSLPYALMSGADVYPMGSQGPAELRRLLTWASKKRCGGIIIIDEAESALGSREKTGQDKTGSDGVLECGKTASSSEFSRDCLNCLLSMTGSFGNIMLVLTTSNPSELDEAVLDRMDDIISLPLPGEHERHRLLRNHFFRQFERFDDDHTSLTNQLLSNFCRSATTKARFDISFDVQGCLSDLALDSNTKGFSGRELEKIIQGILYKTYASDKGVLGMELWRKETMALVEAVTAKHALVRRKG